MMNEKERNELFMKELTTLSKKHGVKIWGCGCCGSPQLSTMKEEEIVEDALYVEGRQLQYIVPGTYEWDSFYDEEEE
jgi:hypothetical protein